MNKWFFALILPCFLPLHPPLLRTALKKLSTLCLLWLPLAFLQPNISCLFNLIAWILSYRHLKLNSWSFLASILSLPCLIIVAMLRTLLGHWGMCTFTSVHSHHHHNPPAIQSSFLISPLPYSLDPVTTKFHEFYFQNLSQIHPLFSVSIISNLSHSFSIWTWQ